VHGEAPAEPERLLAFRPLDPTNRPAPFKTYPGLAAVPLPRQIRRSTVPATDVLAGRSGDPSELDVELLATLLFLSAGVTRVARMAGGEPIWFRTAMSAGNLHPVEVYVVREGVHHYQPLEHALVPLRPPAGPGDAGAATTIVLTGIPFRTCWKYGERGWRHLWWDAGCLLANLLAVAAAHGVPAEVVTGFCDSRVIEMTGIDGLDEVPLAVVHLGEGPRRVLGADGFGPVAGQADPIARRVLRFPLVVDAQAASAFDDHQAEGWKATLINGSRQAPAEVDPPSAPGAADRIEDVILRRGSARVFRRRTVPGVMLAWPLAAATRAVPFDGVPARTLLEHFVNVHDVAGADAGGYLYRGDGQFDGCTAVDDARAAGTLLCLDQPLGGDSAYTVFHAATLELLLAALGGRGYRAALLEAGVASGRLALNAVALGAGVTGLTFYDAMVSRYFHTAATPLLATAVGVRDSPPAPGGPPGQPIELRGYGRVMVRLVR
jgi:SagB-type dehydrogenase family enzyme